MNTCYCLGTLTCNIIKRLALLKNWMYYIVNRIYKPEGMVVGFCGSNSFQGGEISPAIILWQTNSASFNECNYTEYIFS